jgi:hypothetical protein
MISQMTPVADGYALFSIISKSKYLFFNVIHFRKDFLKNNNFLMLQSKEKKLKSYLNYVFELIKLKSWLCLETQVLKSYRNIFLSLLIVLKKVTKCGSLSTWLTS